MNCSSKILSPTLSLIVVLHVLIPHKHYLEMSAEEHRVVHFNASGIIERLSLAFHQDLSLYVSGQENVQIADQKISKLPKPLGIAAGQLSSQIALHSSQLKPAPPFYQSVTTRFIGLRGPPAHDLFS